MSDLVKDGLPLGLRFYDTIGKQSRFQYDCRKGVSHNEYQYTDECTLPPFQLVRQSLPGTSIEVTIICVDTGEEYVMSSLCAALIADITIKTIGVYDYITYKGNNACCTFLFAHALVYLRVEDGSNTWYSELFFIDGNMEDVDTYYRLWTPSDSRTFDGIDLRIWRE